MTNLRNLFAASLGALLALTLLTLHPARAAEIKLLAATVTEMVLRETGAEFERKTGHKIIMKVDLGANFKRQIDAGETFDVAAFAATSVDELVKEGKITASTRVGILSTGIGVAVRRGATKPDISSVDAFKRTLLEAKSVAYLRDGPSGVYLAGLLQRLGIADQVNAKAKIAGMDVVPAMIANGEAEIGIVVIPNILNVPGAEVVGPLPSDIQSTIYFAGGVRATAKEPAAAKQLLDFLRSPPAVAVIKAKSISPD
jgi:molybdate transport system substrate-binding protein